jgi:hypothetical protein
MNSIFYEISLLQAMTETDLVSETLPGKTEGHEHCQIQHSLYVYWDA